MKVLGDLISKDEQNGQYVLSEKGRIAVALIGKFQTVTESSTAALKTRLKLGIALGLVATMAAVSLFFLVVGIPGSSSTIAMECASGNGCISSSHFATTITPTLYALIPLALAAVAGFGFYRMKLTHVLLVTAILFVFSFISLFSIGIIYFPFGIALIILFFANRSHVATTRQNV